MAFFSGFLDNLGKSNVAQINGIKRSTEVRRVGR